MNNHLVKREAQRYRRSLRVRKTVRGSSKKPRLSVVKTNKHLIAQLIDDDKRTTLAGLSTLSKELKAAKLGKKSRQAAQEIGKKIAAMAQEKQIQEVVFDRGRFKFHGLIAEVATAARAAGLKF